MFKTRDPAAYLYPDQAWKAGFIGGDYQWLLDHGRSGRNMDARTFYFYMATVNTPAMAAEMIGLGSQYAIVEVDSSGTYLEGGRDYRLRLPASAPAKEFWSLVVYDPQTRSELQTGQTFTARDSMRDPIVHNDDGTVDMTFGPTEPAERSANWIQTVDGRAGSSSCACTARSSRGSSAPGDLGISNGSTKERKMAEPLASWTAADVANLAPPKSNLTTSTPTSAPNHTRRNSRR